MSRSIDFFMNFWAKVKMTQHWDVMANTVEGSEWHREANVAVHTTMCIDHYLETTAADRSERHRLMTLVALLFHDFGKPEAEETLPAKDGSDRTYHRYAGHEPKSANEFVSFIMSHEVLTTELMQASLTWEDFRKIKWMIEHHLPYGLKNETKRQNLRLAMTEIMGEDEQCFYDMLWSDCNGRISDDHETKRQNVLTWIAEFKVQKAAVLKPLSKKAPTMFMLTGPVGVGKSTWIKEFRAANPDLEVEVVSEDVYRVEFFKMNLDHNELASYGFATLDAKTLYATAWQYCFDHSKEYDRFAREMLVRAVESGKTLILDRTNQTRKSRSPWISAAKQRGYRIHSIEFYCSEQLSHARQEVRKDKAVPYGRAHQIYMAFEVPWMRIEVDEFTIVPTFG